MGLVSRGEEQPDLLLPLLGTHPTLAWRCWHLRAKNFLSWRKRGACAGLGETPQLAQGR